MTKILDFTTLLPETPGLTTAALFLLHGLGANEQAMLPLTHELDSRLHIISLRAPLPMGGQRYCWFPVQYGDNGPEIDVQAATQSRVALVEFIRQYKASHSNRPVFLMGFSQGATLALVTLLTNPGELEGVVCFSGRFPQEFAANVSTPPGFKGVRAWVGHGREDGILPIAHAREVERLLVKLAIHYEYQEFPGQHEVTPEMLRAGQRWLREQLDEATPVVI